MHGNVKKSAIKVKKAGNRRDIRLKISYIGRRTRYCDFWHIFILHSFHYPSTSSRSLIFTCEAKYLNHFRQYVI